MKIADIKNLKPGVYRLHWKTGGHSLASVGMLSDGTRWYAPANWASSSALNCVATDWRHIGRVELIEEVKFS